MTVSDNSKRWKTWIVCILAILLTLDVALIILDWRNAETATGSQKLEAAHLKQETAQFEKDVARAQAIRNHMPEVRKNCEHFYTERFLPASTGYSSVVADLGELAGHAGLKTTGVTFKQRAIEKRGVLEIDINASIEGDYPSLIHFINGLERSKNLYLLDQLTLASVSTGSIKLQLELRTYFRS